MSANANAFSAVGRNWGWVLAYGVLLIIAGFIAMANPIATGLAVGVILGISFTFSGVASLFAAFADAGWRAKTVDILFGLLALFAAFVCLANPFSGAVSVVWVIGFMFLIAGAYEIVAGFQADQDKIWLILLGAVDLALGVWVTVFMGAGVALVALATLVGFGFLFRGALISALAFKLRGLAKG